MAIKYLSGAYPGGYSLSASYSGLVIEAAASVGGAGVSAAFLATIQNLGVVNADGSGVGLRLGGGGMATNGAPGDTSALIEGYGGVVAGDVATLVNYGSIAGDTSPGVLLSAGGSVINGSAVDSAALITGATTGVVMSAPGSVANFGTIRGTAAFGVVLTAGGTVTNGADNDTTAVISGYNSGVLAQTAAATVINFGTIHGAPFYGVRLTAGGAVINGSAGDTSALIGGQLGVLASGGAATITNFGTIAGAAGQAVVFNAPGGRLVVEAGCVFQGGVFGDGGTLELATGTGVITSLGAGGTVTVSGSMAATTFTSFSTVEIAAGAHFTVTATGVIGDAALTLLDNGFLALVGGVSFAGAFGEAAGATLDLLAGGGGKVVLTGPANLAGTLEGKGALRLSNATIGALTVSGRASLYDAGTIGQTGDITRAGAKAADSLTVAKGAAWTLQADCGIALPQIDNNGLFIKSGGAGRSVIAATVADAGSIVAASGTLDFTGSLTGSGTLTVRAGATLEADGPVAATLSVTLHGAGAVLALAKPALFAAAVTGFAPGQTIDLLGKAATSATLGGGDTLVVTNGSRAVATLQLVGDYSGETFGVVSDGQGGTDITVTAGPGGTPPKDASSSPAPVHAFVAAMARVEAPCGGVHLREPQTGPAPMLARP